MNEIRNQVGIDYDYRIDPNGPDLQNSVQSNETEVDLVLGELRMTKTVDKEYATIGDILNYTVVLENIGNILLTNIEFTDILPSEATFVSESVSVDGTPQPSYDPNSGFDLGSMLIAGDVTVTYQATVTSLPTPNIITNQAESTFNYLVIVPITGESSSNSVTTTINVTELNILKSADVTAAKSGDTITYTIVIENTGNVDATNVLFTDVIDANTTFVTGSVIIDEASEPTYDPNTGFILPNIVATDSCEVSFEVTVN